MRVRSRRVDRSTYDVTSLAKLNICATCRRFIAFIISPLIYAWAFNLINILYMVSRKAAKSVGRFNAHGFFTHIRAHWINIVTGYIHLSPRLIELIPFYPTCARAFKPQRYSIYRSLYIFAQHASRQFSPDGVLCAPFLLLYYTFTAALIIARALETQTTILSLLLRSLSQSAVMFHLNIISLCKFIRINEETRVEGIASAFTHLCVCMCV